MKLKGLIDEDFVNYKLPSMYLATTHCSFKCDKECGRAVCQNSPLAIAPDIEVMNAKIIHRYLENDITKAVVIAGLEPFDDSVELLEFIYEFRRYSDDDIVIYTGYYEHEIQPLINKLKNDCRNIVIKFGRYIPNQQPHYDEVLGVKLASDNQKGVKIC